MVGLGKLFGTIPMVVREAFWYYSHGGEVHRRAGVRSRLFGQEKRVWVLFGKLGYWDLAGLAPQELAGEKGGNLAGKTGTGTVWEVRVLGFGKI
nr:hypothetical protein [Tanacetum cinerariifolium]